MMSMGNVWDRTAEFLSDYLGTVLPIALLAIFVPLTISANLTPLYAGASQLTVTGLAVVAVLLGLVSLWGQLAITALTLDPALGRHVTSVATRSAPAAVLLAVLKVVVVTVLAIPPAVILADAGVDLSVVQAGVFPEIPPPVQPWVALYGLLVVAVGFWVVPRLVLLNPAIVGDRLAIGAIARSWRLTRGAALKIVGVLILYHVVAWVSYLAATKAFGAIMYLVAGRGEDGISLASVLTTIVGAAVSTGFTVLGTAFVAKLYIALLARHEAVARA